MFFAYAINECGNSEVSFWFLKLVESGEKERLMELLRERLVECGWRDDMKALCRFGSPSIKVQYNASHVFTMASNCEECLISVVSCDHVPCRVATVNIAIGFQLCLL